MLKYFARSKSGDTDWCVSSFPILREVIEYGFGKILADVDYDPETGQFVIKTNTKLEREYRYRETDPNKQLAWAIDCATCLAQFRRG